MPMPTKKKWIGGALTDNFIWAFLLVTTVGLFVSSFVDLANLFYLFLGFAECFAFQQKLFITIPNAIKT